MRERESCVFSSYSGTVKGCVFPQNHPSFSFNQNANDISRAHGNFFYVYETGTTDCTGCVSTLHLCYLDDHYLVLTVAIIDAQRTITHLHNITASPGRENYHTSCAPNGVQGIYDVFCCTNITLELREQFEIQNSFYYGLKTYSGNSSQVLFDEYTTGYFSDIYSFGDIVVGYTVPSLQSVVYQPFFYFNIEEGKRQA